MSKLYEILKQLEVRKGPSVSPEEPPPTKSSGSRRNVVIAVGILALFGFSALGGLYLSNLLLSSKAPSSPKKAAKTATSVNHTPGPHTPPPPSESSVKTAIPLATKTDSKKRESKSEIILPKATAPKSPEKPKTGLSVLKKTKSPPPKPQVSRPVEKKNPPKKPPDLSEEPLLSSVRKESVGRVPRFGPEERLRGILVRAEALRQEGGCEKALPLYREYLKERREPEVLNNYAACLFLLGYLEDAERIFKESLELKDDPEVRLNLLILALKKGSYAEACREFERLKNRSELRLYKTLIQILEERCP